MYFFYRNMSISLTPISYSDTDNRMQIGLKQSVNDRLDEGLDS
ncbi:hypothetical protein HSR121_2723 [Halapricum desulfuricans]|uniref:Uncharacterized protein n=1 Tax=Halapricum desulfuricans TaxID=2841257 RepID=A0A897N776_9EURY|nr:hypothetical protein HSR121_2723 [Halapricum desulfuricans]